MRTRDFLKKSKFVVWKDTEANLDLILLLERMEESARVYLEPKQKQTVVTS